MKHYLEQISWPVIGCINYKNCLVWKVIGGFKVFSHVVKTGKEVDEKIAAADKAIEDSIVRGLEKIKP